MSIPAAFTRHRGKSFASLAVLLIAITSGTHAQASTVPPQQRLIDLVNQQRAKAKLPPFRINQKLGTAAQTFADDMNKRQYFSHVTPEGKKLLDRLKDSGYFASPCASCRWKAAYAEDIAYGSQSMDQLIQSWMKSKEDRANILNPAFVDIGVGMNGFFLVQDFGAITVTNPPPLSSSALAALKQRVIDLVNSERAKAKLPALQAEPHLDKAAQSQAADLTKRNYFNHISPEGTTPSDRIKAAGYAPIPPCNGCSFNTYYGENIAKNQETAQEVMTAWMNSPGHRANILNPKFQDIGIGIDGPSWVQEFGGVDVSKNGAAKP